MDLNRTYVALLRGINVGGKHLLPMTELRALLRALGCVKVRTYIQSGNAVFEAPAARIAKLPQALEGAIFKSKGFPAPVVLRSAAEIAAVPKANPFLAAGDAFVVRGTEVYLKLGQGAATTKLTNTYFDLGLKTVCTMRNWRTVQTL